ncbi:hypothetical protein SCP_0105880 [Sparassis crispa]|uniref:Retrotransposon gag domain-containing protein n=1 Tax=Sparassis crispa TaxID=139825 RepID=A0A401G6B1_9APHY|nr:hypothetical protein SCP_0105880 [Sparassis crispa]GBE77706.1 hypothetical protein SCP_0105880 [Sparassis crispa]
MVDEMVSRDPIDEPPAYLRVTKMPPPLQYDEKDDLDAFEVWLQKLLEYFKTLRITGDAMDADRLQILGQSLKDDAANWFFLNVQSPNCEVRKWYFEDAVTHLHRQFLHKDSELIASEKYDKAMYSLSRGGVSELYNRLLHHADRMVQYPTEYAFRKRFMDTLPLPMVEVMHLAHLLSPEKHTIDALYRSALAIEQGNGWLDQYCTYKDRRQPQKAGDHTGTRSSSKAVSFLAPMIPSTGDI